MIYGHIVGKDYGDTMAIDVYIQKGTTSQIRSKIMGNTCGVSWVATATKEPFTATEDYLHGGESRHITTYIANLEDLKNSSWVYRIEDVLDSSVAYDFPVTLYNGPDAECGDGNPSPSPSPSPSSNPSPTPSPTPTSTPSPFPSVPTGDGLCESPQVANDVNTLANQLAPLVREASQITGQEIPFDVPNGGDFRTQFINPVTVNLAMLALEETYITLKSSLEAARDITEESIQTNTSLLTAAEQQKATLLERRQNVHQTKMDRDVKNAIIQDIKEQLNQLSPQIQELQNALKILERYLVTTEHLLSKIYALEDSILETANNLVSCVTNGNGNGGDNGNGGGNPPPSSSPTPDPYESPCPAGMDMQSMVAEYDAKAQAKRKVSDGTIGKGKTIAISEVIENNVKENLVAHSGETSRLGTVRTPDEDGRDPIFEQTPMSPNKGKRYNITDAERKIMEFIAHQQKYNGTKPNNILLYADRETCKYCKPIAREYRGKFPSTKLFWFDKTGKCY